MWGLKAMLLELGPAGLILVGFMSTIGGIVGVFSVTGFAVRKPFEGSGR